MHPKWEIYWKMNISKNHQSTNPTRQSWPKTAPRDVGPREGASARDKEVQWASRGDRMRKIVNETQQLHLCIVKKMDLKTPEELRDPTVTCSIVVNNATAKRNKRMALAYVNERLNRIKRMWWTRSSILPEDMKHNMSQAEKDFFEGYDKILSAYCQDIDVDLASVDKNTTYRDPHIHIHTKKSSMRYRWRKQREE
eukprot:70909-Amorphochlora_amoeboformis.AAC.2